MWQGKLTAGYVRGELALALGLGMPSAKFQVKSFQLAPTGHMLQNSQINFTSCETFHAFEMQMKCARLLTSSPRKLAEERGHSGKWKCRWQMKMPMEVETEVAVKVELQLELKAKAAAQAQS